MTEVQKAYRQFVSILTRDPEECKPSDIGNRCGEVVDTVEKMLAEVAHAMHIGEIKEAVEQRLEREVSRATIEDLLYKHSRTGRILRVRRGMYASPSSGLSSSPPIADTIVAVLRNAGEPMKLQQIHAECEVMLGGSVSYLAVKSAVSRYATGRITRVDYAWYAASPED